MTARRGSGGRRSFGELKAELDTLGFRPTKRLGQNFLVDDALAASIAKAADIDPHEFVLEVGVGLGFLTRHLVQAGARVLGVEIDARLAGIARAELAALEAPAGSFELIEVDALAGKHELAPELVERLPNDSSLPWQLVANLPYAIATPLLVLLAVRPHPPRRITTLVQLELVERLLARPGDSAWGGPSVPLALLYTGRLIRRVPARLFRPRPKVESAVVQLELRSDAPPCEQIQRVRDVSAHLFTQRKRRLRHPLAQLVPDGLEGADRLISGLGLEPESRVESLPLKVWLALADALKALESGT